MPTPADSLRLAIAEEISQGVLPASPTFEIFRTTGEGLSFEITSTISDEISSDSRGVTDSILTGATVTGDINYELADFDAFELAMASLLASDWGLDPKATGAAYPANVGTADAIYDSDVMKTFTIEKRMTSTPLNGAASEFLFQLFNGCTVDTWSLSITPNEIITGSFGFIGMEMLTPETEAGAVYNDAGLRPVMTAPLVTGIALLTYMPDGTRGQQVAWLSGSCFTGLEITANNNGRGLVCIGTLGNKATALGRFEVSISGSLYYTGDEPLDALIDQTPYQLEIICSDSDGSTYTFFFPRVKFATATALASGTNTDVMVEFTMNALVDSFRKYTMYMGRMGVVELSSAVAAADGQTAATGSLYVDDDNGTLHAVVTQSGVTPTGSQIIAGTDENDAAADWAGTQGVSTLGTQTLNPAPSGLTAGTSYWIHYAYTEAGTGITSIATSNEFMTDP